eukprot:3053720-Prymnesium_polylepis.1
MACTTPNKARTRSVWTRATRRRCPWRRGTRRKRCTASATRLEGAGIQFTHAAQRIPQEEGATSS